MRFLLSNDDGIDAPGLLALYEAARLFGEPTVVAPTAAHSGCSHRVTTSQPLRFARLREGWYAVDGTPADCIRVALHQIVGGPIWVLSGINAGGNLGADVYHSGTVAAVREGVLHGCPGVAFSHYVRRGLGIDWPRATAWVARLLENTLEQPWSNGQFWNINFPHLEADSPDPEIVRCPLDPLPLPLSFRLEGEHLHYDGNYHERPRNSGTDVDVCFSGKIAVTRIRL